MSGEAKAPLSPQASEECRATIGGVRLCYQTFGDPEASPLLLIMGLSTQMILWDEEFCQRLADEGFWVIRFDNRDVGRSSVLHDAPVPTRWQLAVRDARAAAYSLDEMADDAVGLLDHRGSVPPMWSAPRWEG